MNKDEIRQLKTKKKYELIEIAEKETPPIKVKRGWDRNRIYRTIVLELKKRIRAAASAAQGGREGGADGSTPPNPEFEKLLEQAEQETPVETRGGSREGAGHPEGMTKEKAAVKNLPKQPNRSVKSAIDLIFILWSERTKVLEVKLTPDQSDALALPTTQLLEYYFPDAIPEIAWTWFMMITAVADVTYAKIALIREVHKQRKAVESQCDEIQKPAQQPDGKVVT